MFGAFITTHIIIGALVYAVVYMFNTGDTEYLGVYVTKATYYEPWDEMVRHTRRVPCGTDEDGNTIYRTEVYYTREYHSEYYEYQLNNNQISRCNKREFDKIVNKLSVRGVFKDMHRDYHSIDGDAYEYFFDGTRGHCYTTTIEHSYRNHVNGNGNSIFKYHITEADKKQYKLYDYPKYSIMNDQNPIIGYNASMKDIESFQYINAWYGKDYQFRMFIMFFDTDNMEVAEMQRCYLEGGNKNEFIVCLGHVGDSITWCYPFSWQDKPMLEVRTRQFFIENPRVDFHKFSEFIISNLNCWHRKEFKDFDYLSVDISMTTYIIFSIIVILLNVIFMVDYKRTHSNNYYYNRY